MDTCEWHLFLVQEQRIRNPGALLAQHQAARESPREQLALMRMLLTPPNQAPPRQPSPYQPPPWVRSQNVLPL